MDIRQSILNQTDHSLFLCRHLISEHRSNLVFSPLSIHAVLGMIAAGANGPTRDQILSFLMSTSLEALNYFFSKVVSELLVDAAPLGGPILSTVNGIWVDHTFSLKPAYRDVANNVYRAVCQPVDFKNKARQVTEQVNAWGSKQTNGVINNVLPLDAVNPHLTRLILANAIYFKATWSKKFPPSSTQNRDFYLLNGGTVRAPLMSSGEPQHFRAFDGFKAVRLPYKQGHDARLFSMYIYLPDARDGLPSLWDRVCSQPGFIDSHLPCNDLVQLDEFRIPKFKMRFDFEASGLLKRLGLVLPFVGGELSEMVAQSPLPLVVSKVFHNSFVEVNEEGTEAAAVTVALVAFGACMMAPEPRDRVVFVADHPFLFVIREDTSGVVLFVGQVLNPLDQI